MNVLLIGSGGREHALAWAILASPLLGKLYCAPGNAGIAEVAECVALDVADHAAVIRFCREKRIDLVVVGPEAPLVAGLADDLTEARIKVFGPSRAAAQLEGSKGFTKDFCAEHGIPTAAYANFDNLAAALAHIESQPLPVVVKADGLAAGKGVTIAETRQAAVAAVEACFSGALGDGGVVIEEFLEVRRRASSRSSMAATPSRWPPPRITNALSTATEDPTPAAWAPTHRPRWSRQRSPAAPWMRSSGRP